LSRLNSLYFKKIQDFLPSPSYTPTLGNVIEHRNFRKTSCKNTLILVENMCEVNTQHKFLRETKMRKGMILNITLVISVFLVTLCVAESAAGGIIYVDANATGVNDGSSWVDAYNFLQDALMVTEAGDEIWVAQGIYKPHEGLMAIPEFDWRTATFQLVNGTAIKGGYAGLGEPDPNARSIKLYETILSGDLNGNDTELDVPAGLLDDPHRADNSYNVVMVSDVNDATVLDGFTIAAGNASLPDYPSLYSKGGGLHITGNSNLTVTNCTLRNNSAHWGGGMRNESSGNLMVSKCVFSRNLGLGEGGGVHSTGNTIMADCIFNRNIVTNGRGGGMHIAGNMRLINCTFSNNSAGDYGGGVYTKSGYRQWITNCIFTGNSAAWFGGGISCNHCRPTLTNCTFADNSAQEGRTLNCGSALQSDPSDIKLINCLLRNGGNEIFNRDNSTIDITFSSVEVNTRAPWPGEGNININPHFADPGNGDYHLKSQAGRWDTKTQSWVQDDITSSCIDAGDPNSSIGTEPFPNGGYANMGAYGAGDKASKSYFGKPVCETVIAGDINGDCIVDIADLAIMLSHWMIHGDIVVNNPPAVTLIEPQDGAQIEQPGSVIFLAEATDPESHVDSAVLKLQQKNDTETSIIELRGKMSGSWERKFEWMYSISPGEWTAWIEATDNEGAVGASSKITISYNPE
jgi:predicted outer membrane repeat protein